MNLTATLTELRAQSEVLNSAIASLEKLQASERRAVSVPISTGKAADTARKPGRHLSPEHKAKIAEALKRRAQAKMNTPAETAPPAKGGRRAKVA